MTLQEYIDQIRRVLDEYETEISFWSDEELIYWLNEGLKEVAKGAKHLTNRAYIEPTDDKEYKLPNDFIDWYKVKMNDEFISNISITEQGEETGFYIWGDRIFLSEYDEEGKITLYYYRAPKKMETMLDESELPKQYEEIIIPFCLYRAFMKDQKSEMANLNYNEFSQRVKAMRRRYNNEPSKTSWKVVRR